MNSILFLLIGLIIGFLYGVSKFERLLKQFVKRGYISVDNVLYRVEKVSIDKVGEIECL